MHESYSLLKKSDITFLYVLCALCGKNSYITLSVHIRVIRLPLVETEGQSLVP